MAETSGYSASSPEANLCGLSLCEVSAGLRDGRFASVDLTSAYFARIRLLDARIRAWAWIDEEAALARAREADRARAAGSPMGPLHGVPLGVKDIIYSAGIPTGMGSPIFADFVPDYSATCIERLESAGGFVQGKTITSEFATRHPGPTANPWNVAFTPGGSSSGSAAAVAAGFCIAALATQTVGSIIRPAVYCGVVGYKPSFGLISRFGVHRVSQTLDHVGVVARSADDAGLLVYVLMGDDGRDPAVVASARMPAHLDNVGEAPCPPRIAAVRSASWESADDDQRRLFESNCAALGAAGAHVEDVVLAAHFNRANEVTRTIQAAEAASNFQAMMARDAARTSVEFRELCERGARVSAVDYLAALDLRRTLQADLEQVFTSFDAIAMPPATGEAPHSLADTGSAVFCAIGSLCGVPCVSFPTATGPNGLPMGLQIIGSYLSDRRTLQTAKWCMQHLPFRSHPRL